VLVHSDYGGVNHLRRRIRTGGKRIQDLVPDASPPPPNEAIVTSGAGTIGFRQVAPWRTRAEDPKETFLLGCVMLSEQYSPERG
jgi:hypothetical protein